MRKATLLINLIGVLVLTSCGGSQKTKAIEDEIKKAKQELVAKDTKDPVLKLVEEIETSYVHSDKEVSFNGYLIPGKMSVVGKDDFVNIPLCENENGGSSSLIIAKVHFGKTKNSIHFPEEFYLKDAEIYDNSGQKLLPSNKVKITGTVTYLAKGPIAKPVFNDKTPEALKKQKMEIYEMKVAQGDGNDYSFDFVITDITKAE